MPRAFYKSNYFDSQAHTLNHLQYLHKQSPLFSGLQDISIDDALSQASEFDQACKWWFVFSLERSDAERLQIDRSYFKNLLESKKAIWAKAYNIPPERLHIYASFHDVDHHPHLHVVLHGEKPSDGFIYRSKNKSLGDAFKSCRQTVKGSIANEIFKEDTLSLKSQKSEQRQSLNEHLNHLLLDIGRSTRPINSEIRTKMEHLSHQLHGLPGKHHYGYLPPALKLQVDDVLKTILQNDQQLAEMFELYKKTQQSIIDYLYVDSHITLSQKIAAWENDFFHPQKGGDARCHNIIITACQSITTATGEPNKKSTAITTSPLDSDVPVPWDSDVPPPLDSDVPVPWDSDVPPPLDSDVPVPWDSDVPPPLDSDVPVPWDSDVPLPLDSDVPAPWNSDAPPPLDSDVPVPWDSDVPPPLDSDVPVPWDTNTSQNREPNEKKEIDFALIDSITQETIAHFSRELSVALPDPIKTILKNLNSAQNISPKDKAALLKQAQQDFFKHYSFLEEAATRLDNIYQEAGISNEDFSNLLNYKIEQYSRFYEDGFINLSKLNNEKEKKQKYQYFMCQVKSAVTDYLDNHSELQKLIEQVKSAPIIKSKDGTELPISYNTLPKKLQQSVNSLLNCCAMNDKIQNAEQYLYSHFGSDQDLEDFKNTLLYGNDSSDHKHIVGYGQRAVVKLLLEYAPLEPKKETANPPSTDPLQNNKEIESALQTIRWVAEKALLNRQYSSVETLLVEINCFKNATGSLQSLQKMSDAQQDLVQQAVKNIISSPDVQSIIQAIPTDLQEKFKACLDDVKSNPLYNLICTYAEKATAECAVNPIVPAIRKADHELISALDATLCKILNSTPENNALRLDADNLAEAIYQKIGKRERLENSPMFYRQLSPPQKEAFYSWFESVLSTPAVRTALSKRKTIEPINDVKAYFSEYNTRLINLALSRLNERWSHPNELLTVQYTVYRSKNNLAAIRSALYMIGSAFSADMQQQQYQPSFHKKSLRRKRIHRQTITERHEESRGR